MDWVEVKFWAQCFHLHLCFLGEFCVEREGGGMEKIRGVFEALLPLNDLECLELLEKMLWLVGICLRSEDPT